MPAAVLTDSQQRVLDAVKAARPHAVPSELARILDMNPGRIGHVLNALTRRGLVTPIGIGRDEILVYVATAKGRAR